jgi:SAM-dependent methyltransferase
MSARPPSRETDALPDAIARALPLLDPAVREAGGSSFPDVTHGYVDLLGAEAEAETTGPAGRLMVTRALPVVYERWWRPAWGRVLRGAMAGGMRDEHRIARLLLGLTPGDGVLDVACGPGNFTRDFARVTGEDGLAVGIDASTTMLERAVRDTPVREFPAAAYVRGNAVELPFRDQSFDAVCCFAALHFFDDPFRALDHMTRVLTPGGRIAILTSCRLRTPPLRTVDGLLGARSGQRMFERDEITGALEQRGFKDVRQRIGGLAQFVGGRLG